MSNVKLWARVGVAFDLPENLAKKIIQDKNNDAVEEILSNPEYAQFWKFDGEVYEVEFEDGSQYDVFPDELILKK